jgi:hypothetical protein
VIIRGVDSPGQMAPFPALPTLPQHGPSTRTRTILTGLGTPYRSGAEGPLTSPSACSSTLAGGRQENGSHAW